MSFAEICSINKQKVDYPVCGTQTKKILASSDGNNCFPQRFGFPLVFVVASTKFFFAN
jgi:hypothetical protein